MVSGYANACDCVAIDRDKAFAQSSAVVVAKLTGQVVEPGDKGGRIASEFSVVKALKGDYRQVKKIVSFTSSNSCWKPLLTGEVYVFYAQAGAEFFYSKCSPHERIEPGTAGR